MCLQLDKACELCSLQSVAAVQVGKAMCEAELSEIIFNIDDSIFPVMLSTI
jgi:hypothetical protein